MLLSVITELQHCYILEAVLMSFLTYILILFQTLRSHVCNCSDKILLANNESVQICATANIRLRKSLNDIGCYIFVYVLKDASHPLILGTQYMQDNNISVDFLRNFCVLLLMLNVPQKSGVQERWWCSRTQSVLFRGYLMTELVLVCKESLLVIQS